MQISTFLLYLQIFSLLCCSIDGYPLLVQVPEGGKRCFRFNIPQDDDAHMVFLGLPGNSHHQGVSLNKIIDDPNNELEQFFVEEVYEISKRRDDNGNLPTKIQNLAPDSVLTKMDKFINHVGNDGVTGLSVKVGYKKNYPLTYNLVYFAPTVLSYVVKNTPPTPAEVLERAGINPELDTSDLEGHEVCFDNRKNHKYPVTVAVDIALVSDKSYLDDIKQDDKDNKPSFQKEKHLTPLEEVLTKSITAANQVLKEMKYVGQREDRMAKTADRINMQLQYFSVLSVVILISVTYLQVTYLKRYFHKLKLM